MKRDYIEFQDRSVAKGYLITFRCYGTWLHGDERGSVDRRFYNRIGTPKMQPDIDHVERKAKLRKQEVFIMGAEEREVVEKAIAEVCHVRGYFLFAVNVRTNHAHLVVGNSGVPERMMDSCKAYATKALRSAGLIDSDYKPWSWHGSTSYLWTDEHITQAIDYVVNGQGGDLPSFE
jgi:REP element-mobilizing transposase RayT